MARQGEIKVMKIGILKTGDVAPQLTKVHGEYADMFERLLTAVEPSLQFVTVDVVGGAALGAVDLADGWLITGSRHGVYDDFPWIEPLKQFIRTALAAKVPVAGVCFGHQILAEAMGGRAEKSPKGWGLGRANYHPAKVPDWMGDLAGDWSGYAVHQDQVTQLPDDATVIAGNDFCNYAALAYGDPDRPIALSVQPHPEFDAAFVDGLIDVRLKEVVPADRLAAARQSLAGPVQNSQWATVLVEFFQRCARQRPEEY